MNNAVRYQVMPPLSSEEYQELFESIKSDGVLEPIHVDEEGVVIDGHHRSRIAKELSIPCPVITHDDLSESGKRSLAFTLNLKRRHLNREQRNALVAESLKLDPLARDQEHARRTGADPKTVKRIRADEGIPTPDEVIREYAEERPEKSNREIARDLGVSHPTVAEIRGGKKRDNPENYHPAPELDDAPPAPGFNPGELDEINLPAPKPETGLEPTKPQGADKAGTHLTDVADQIATTLEILETMNYANITPQNKEKALNLLEQATRSLTNIKKQLR